MTQTTDTDLHELTTEQVSLTGLYRLIVAGLLLAILVTGVLIALQAQERHKVYQEITRLKRELTVMKVEESSLIIEQQMFSATPQVARRSVSELSMYYPTKKEQIQGDVGMTNTEQGALHD